ncbi:MAG: hypothetical protein U1F11_04930 [Steroidobacteraceae bacterium]
MPTQHVLPNAPREGIVINAAAMRLYYFPKRKPGEKQVVYTHPIGIGKVGWATPEARPGCCARPGIDLAARSGRTEPEHKENGEILPAVVPPGRTTRSARAPCTSPGRPT